MGGAERSAIISGGNRFYAEAYGMPRHRLLKVQTGDQYCSGGWECVDSDGEDE